MTEGAPFRATAIETEKYRVVTQCHRYEGRVAIVVGGAQGLGRVTAKRLAEEGARVVIADVQEERGSRTARELGQETGQPFIWVGGDLSNPETANSLAKCTLEEFGRIDTLVNVAAYQARLPLLEFPEEEMRKSVNWNVWNLVYVLRAVLPVMMEQRYGRIVTCGGGAFETGGVFHTFLAGIGKGSQVGLATTVAGEFGSYGITANCISPGGMETRHDGTPDSQAGGRDPHLNASRQQRERYPSRTGGGPVLQRHADMTEVAAAIAFLGSPEASWVTGQYIGVNGGAHML